MMNDGLWTRAGSIPSPRAMPRTRLVFPAPRSPMSPISSPPCAARPSASPTASVSSGERAWSSIAATVPASAWRFGPRRRLYACERRGDLLRQIAREEPHLPLPLRDRVSRRTVHENRENGRLEGREALSEKRTDDARQHVARAAARHARVARRRDRSAAVGIGDDRPRTLQHDDDSLCPGQLACRPETVALDVRRIRPEETRHLA